MRYEGPGDASGNFLQLASLTVNGIIEGTGSRTAVNLNVSGNVTVGAGGFVGGRRTQHGNKGKAVHIKAGGTVTVNGTVQGNRGPAEITAGGNITVGSGGQVNSNGGGTTVTSTGGGVTVAAGGKVTADHNVAIASGSGKPTVIAGEVTSRKWNVLINQGVKNPGNVTVSGTITADEVYIKADTLIVTGEIRCRTIQKVVKVCIISGNGKITGQGTDRATRAHDKPKKKEDLGDRSGSSNGIKSSESKIIAPENATVDLRAAPLAIDAELSTIIATGIGGTIDLRQNPPGSQVITSSGPITLMADVILLDPGVFVTDLMGPGPVIELPSGEALAVTTLYTIADYAYPAETTDVQFLVSNMGNVPDNYTLTVSDSLGWSFTQSDLTLALDYVSPEDSLVTVTLDVPPTAVGNADSNRVVLTVTSDSDPGISYTEDAIVVVRPTSDLRDFSLTWWDTAQTTAGETAQVEFWLLNIGQLPDSYTLSVSDTEGWTLQAPTSPVALGPLEEAFPLVGVEIPSDAIAGETNSIILEARSVSDPTEAILDTAEVVVQGFDILDHDAGNIVLSVTDRGILGFLDATQSVGRGLVYPAGGDNLLYVGSVWVSQGDSYIANRDYDADPEKEWVVESEPDGHPRFVIPGVSDQDIVAGVNDDDTQDPFGLYIRQESWAFSDPADDDFVIVRYFIHNRGDTDLTDLRAGLFLDLDIDVLDDDIADTDAVRQAGYITDASGRHAGASILQGDLVPDLISNLTLVENPVYVWPQSYILDEDKLAFMSAADPEHSVATTDTLSDYSLLLAVGPFSLAPGDSNEVSFAIVGGSSRGEFLAHTDRAQERYRSVVAVPGSSSAIPAFRLLPARPNPFRARADVRFELPGRSEVRLDIYDVSGRRVRTLVSEPLEAGPHAMTWDGTDGRGRPLAGGVYFVRLIAGEKRLSGRLVLVK